MPKNKIDLSHIYVRLAETDEEIQSAQEIRYKVFYEEYDAKPNDVMAHEKRDFDEFDDIADHLIVIDESNTDEKIVGTYRLVRQEKAEAHGRFYSEDEYDLSPLKNSKTQLLELGRSCVLPDYRMRPVLQLLWQGIAAYISEHNIDIMFGCASLEGTDIEKLAPQLSYLYHYHLAPPGFRPRALESRYVDMDLMNKDDIDARAVFSELPPLIKGYLRTGSAIGDGAVIDKQFNTTDVCIVMQTHLLSERYRKHYERKIQKNIPNNGASETEQKATPNAGNIKLHIVPKDNV